MRVLHVISRYWPAVGGAEKYLHEISRRLVEAGHSVTVLTSDARDVELFWNPACRRVPEPAAVEAGVQIIRFPVRHLPYSPLTYSLWRYVGLRALAQLPLSKALLARLARYTPWCPALWRWLSDTNEPYDIVAGAGILYEPFVEAGLHFARRRGRPYIVYPLTHFGAGERPGADAVGRYYTMPHQRALVTQSQAVVAMTQTESDYYRRAGSAPSALCVAGAGVNPGEVLGGEAAGFRTRHQLKGPVVAFISAPAADKGATHLVEAVRRLWEAGRQVELVMAGAPLAPFQRYLDGLPAEVRQRLRVLGSIAESEKRDLLAAADLVAMPSRTDSFGIVYLEAWLYRKPVIGARAWGMADVIDEGADGVLVPFGDPVRLAETIAQLLDDPARRSDLGLAGERKVYQRYTWDQVFGRVYPLYERLAEAGQTTASR